MKKISFYSSLFILGAMVCGPIAAEPTDPTKTPTPSPRLKFSMGALVDTQFGYNFTRAFTDGYFKPSQIDFEIALTEFSVELKQGEGAAHLSMIYGETADAFLTKGMIYITDVPVEEFYIWEAYGNYCPGDFSFRFGKFATHLGLEKIESNEDWNCSRSLLFSCDYMPRYHMGLSIGYNSPDKLWGITGYVYNGKNDVILATYLGGGIMCGLKLTVKPEEGLSLVLNGLTGDTYFSRDNVLSDIFGEFIITWKATSELSLALDALVNYRNPDDAFYRIATFWGAALYGRYQIDAGWAVVARIEETEEVDEAYTSPDPDPYTRPETHSEDREATITIERKLTEHILVRLEGRYDYVLFNGQTFAPGDGPYAGGSNDQYTGTIGMVVSF